MIVIFDTCLNHPKGALVGKMSDQIWPLVKIQGKSPGNLVPGGSKNQPPTNMPDVAGLLPLSKWECSRDFIHKHREIAQGMLRIQQKSDWKELTKPTKQH